MLMANTTNKEVLLLLMSTSINQSIAGGRLNGGQELILAEHNPVLGHVLLEAAIRGGHDGAVGAGVALEVGQVAHLDVADNVGLLGGGEVAAEAMVGGVSLAEQPANLAVPVPGVRMEGEIATD